MERVIVLSPADFLPLHLALGYKGHQSRQEPLPSNVIHWKQFIAQGKNAA